MVSDKEAPVQAADLQAKYDSIIEEASQVAEEIQNINDQIEDIHRIAPDLEKNIQDIRDECYECGVKFNPDNPACPRDFYEEDIQEWIESDFDLDDEDKEANRQIRELKKQLSKPRVHLNRLKKQFQSVMLQARRQNIHLITNPQREAQAGLTGLEPTNIKPVTTPQQSNGKVLKHSPDYRSVNQNGQVYTLTSQQAKVIQILHENYKNGTPDVGQDYILIEIEAPGSRLHNIFRSNSEAFKALITVGEKRGTYRLNF